MNLKNPNGYLEIISLVLDVLGIVFLLIGLLGTAVSIPMRNGESWEFGAMGLALLFVSLPCIFAARRRIRRNQELRHLGRPVRGEATEVKCHTWVNYGGDGFRRRSPWTVRCEYRWEGQTYTVRSVFLWERPLESGQTPRIFIDQDRPRRAFVDPDSLKYEIN